MRICVFGGAGYIGSHFCHMARKAGHKIVIFDNFSSGHHFAVRDFEVITGDICDSFAVEACLAKGFDAVCHFAGKISVAESMTDSESYWNVNVAGTKNILDALGGEEIRNLIFSSTAAVYAVNDSADSLSESADLGPVSVYGKTKLAAEKLIGDWVSQAEGNQATVFRYFNAAGAGTEFGLGEAHEPETHLIPNAIYASLDRELGPLHIFGTDYNTLDGTCLRDYVHVLDIADAHLLALNNPVHGFRALNLGSNAGYTVGQVVQECERQLGVEIPKSYAARREGDAPSLVASNQLVLRELGWKPVRSGLSFIVETAIIWHRDLQPAIHV